MITIGNGEPCPYCGKIMENNKIGGKLVLEHLFDKHKNETLTQLFESPFTLGNQEGTNPDDKMDKYKDMKDNCPIPKEKKDG